MTKQIYKYPYNAVIGEETKIFLSDQICEIVKISCKNGQIFCTIRITYKNKKIILSAAIIFGVLLGMPAEGRSMGVPTQRASVPEMNRAAPEYFPKHAPTIGARLDKIIMITNHNKMIPLIYLNGHYSYINQQLLKKLRAGDLTANISIIVVGAVVCIMCKSLGVDGFAIFNDIGKWNAPTIDTGFGLNPADVSKVSRPQTVLQMEKPSAIPQPDYSSLTKSERRQLADPLGRDGFIQIEGHPRLDLRYNQVEYKMPKHGPTHGLPENGNSKTPKTEANALAFRDSLIDMANKPNVIWYTDGQYQGGTSRGCNCINIFDPDTKLIAVYQKQSDGSNLFLTTCALTDPESAHLKSSNGNFVTEKILKEQSAVSLNIQDNTNNNNGLQ